MQGVLPSPSQPSDGSIRSHSLIWTEFGRQPWSTGSCPLMKHLACMSSNVRPSNIAMLWNLSGAAISWYCWGQPESCLSVLYRLRLQNLHWVVREKRYDCYCTSRIGNWRRPSSRFLTWPPSVHRKEGVRNIWRCLVHEGTTTDT